MADLVNELGQPIGTPLETPLPTRPPSADAMVGDSCRVERLSAVAHGDDLFAAFAAAPDDREWTYLPYGPFPEREPFGAWLDACEARTDTMFFAVVDEDGACGIASYLRIAPRSGSVEVGHIHFAERLQRTRASTEAMFLMMQRVFAAGYRRYEWKCDALNAGSRGAAERFGFTFEGVFRQATTYKGRNRDTAWFSIIDDEWPTIESEFVRWLASDNFDSAGAQRSSLRMPQR